MAVMNNLQLLRWLVLFLLKSANEYKGSTIEFTLPGTYWCGPGNSSRNVNDLGYLVKTDECCREHDHCPKYITANQTKYGLKNDMPYTRSECVCDQNFYNCLRGVQSTTFDTVSSALVGNLYFTFLEDQCFQMASPYMDCEINENNENCTILSSNYSVRYEWKTMPPFNMENSF